VTENYLPYGIRDHVCLFENVQDKLVASMRQLLLLLLSFLFLPRSAYVSNKRTRF
jgi:hypothetical protein